MLRAAILLIPMLLFSLALGAGWLVVRAVVRPVVLAMREGGRWLARATTSLLGGALVATAGGFGTALVATEAGLDAPRAAGTLAAILLFPAGVMGLNWWQRREQRRAWEAEAAHAREMAMARRPEPPADAYLADAWDAASGVARGPRDAQRLEAARSACARLLHSADATPLDMEATDCAIVIRRHIPDLVAHTVALCRTAGPEEAAALTEEMILSIEKVAADAERLNERERARLRDGLKVLRTHIDNRTARGPL